MCVWDITIYNLAQRALQPETGYTHGSNLVNGIQYSCTSAATPMESGFGQQKLKLTTPCVHMNYDYSVNGLTQL